VSGNGSGSLNETDGSGVEVLEGAESTRSVTGSDRTNSSSVVSCDIASDGDNAAGELGDGDSSPNFQAPLKMVFHENGAVGEESAAGWGETSGS